MDFDTAPYWLTLLIFVPLIPVLISILLIRPTVSKLRAAPPLPHGSCALANVLSLRDSHVMKFSVAIDFFHCICFTAILSQHNSIEYHLEFSYWCWPKRMKIATAKSSKSQRKKTVIRPLLRSTINVDSRTVRAQVPEERRTEWAEPGTQVSSRQIRGPRATEGGA